MDATPPSPPRADRTADGTLAQRFATGALTMGLVLLAAYTLWNFISALVWAGIFAIALWPFYQSAQQRFGPGRHNVLLPGLFTLAVALLFIIPVGLAGLQFAREFHGIGQWIHDAQKNGIAEPQMLHHLPFFQVEVDDWWKDNLADPGSARELVQRFTEGHVGNVSREIAGQVVRRLTLFVFTLLTLFFLFREGDSVTRQLRRAAVRAFGTGGERVGLQVIASVHGTVNGLVLVGLGEGVLLGFVYAAAGVPQPTVLGALTGVAAMIPFAAPVIFGIASLLLLAKGTIAWAVAVFGIGMAVTFTADHFVRPVLIGGTTRLPFIWVLLGILGGVEVWGLIGLFIGPAIMAALIMLWRDWADAKETVVP